MLFDLFGASCSLLSTYFFIKLDNKAWPVGLLATCLNGWLYWYKGIYADMILEVFYFLSMGYGWYKWQSAAKKYNQPTLLYQLLASQWMALFISLGSVFFVIYTLLTFLTHSSVAFLDAATTSLSLVAQWLMCHKVITTWILWFITDALYAFMYFSKNLPFHCGLMIIYTGLAICGYLRWSRESRQQQLGGLSKEVRT
jgi:nicotinamide mononucleotide transporter